MSILVAMLYIESAIVIFLILVNGPLGARGTRHALLPARPLAGHIDREVTGARRALALASDPGQFLSTVQIGITLVGVLSGAFPGPRSGCVLPNGLPSWACPPVLPRLRRRLWWSR